MPRGKKKKKIKKERETRIRCSVSMTSVRRTIHTDPEAVAHRDGSPRQNALKLFSSFSRGGCAPSFSSFATRDPFYIQILARRAEFDNDILPTPPPSTPVFSLFFIPFSPVLPSIFVSYLHARTRTPRSLRDGRSSSNRCLTIHPSLFFFF